MRFALVIPALNEEEAIAGTLRRCLAARAKVEAETAVEKMLVVFVNDGSTDRTQEIVDADEFSEVVKVRFEKNRGYGAAIKAGWKATPAELVGFIDGDGTCDPDFCVPLLRRLFETGADVVLAGRMNPQSKMPAVRKIGNAFFARLLSLLSGRSLSDSASGFRIVRRESLKLIAPLPDRLHFTPAMSCICMFDPRLRIEEVPMPYEERIGRSKLSVVRDGFRFLFTILFSALFYAPLRMTSLLAAGLLLLYGVLLAILWRIGAPGGLLLALAVLGGISLLSSLGLGLVHQELSRVLLGARHSAGAGGRAPATLMRNERLLGGGLVFGGGAALSLILLGFLAPAWSGRHLPVIGALVLLGLLGGWAALGGLLFRAFWMAGEQRTALTESEFRVFPEGSPGAGDAPRRAAEGGSAGTRAGVKQESARTAAAAAPREQERET